MNTILMLTLCFAATPEAASTRVKPEVSTVDVGAPYTNTLQLGNVTLQSAPSHMPALPSLVVTAIEICANGDIAIGTARGFCIVTKNQVFTYTGPATATDIRGRISEILYSSSSGLWVAAIDGIYQRTKKGWMRWDIPGLGPAVSLHEAPNGDILIGGYHASIVRIEPLSRHAAYILRSAELNDFVISMATIDDTLWVGVNGVGIVQLHDGRAVVHDDSQPWVPSKSVRCVLATADRRLWVGTTNGLGVRSNNGQGVHIDRARLPSATVWSLASSRNGAVWAFTEEGAVYFIDNKISYPVIPNVEHQSKIGYVEMADGTHWIGTTVGIVSSDRVAMSDTNPRMTRLADAKRSVEINIVSTEPTSQSAKDGDGMVWMYIGAELWQYSGSQWSDRTEVIENTSVSCISRDNDSNVWIGTRGAGLIKVRGKTVTRFALEGRDSVVYSVSRGPNGKMYWGTQGGLYCITDGSPRKVHPEYGSECRVQAVQLRVDGNNNVWMLDPDEGVYRYDGEVCVQVLRLRIGPGSWEHATFVLGEEVVVRATRLTRNGVIVEYLRPSGSELVSPQD